MPAIITIEALRSRCVVDPVTHCWHWQGAASHGVPAIWTLDYERVEKRTMSGPLAAWHIAYKAPPRPGRIVFRGCLNRACLNPAHLREARSIGEIGEHARLNGAWKGKALEAKRANIAKAWAAKGIALTPPEHVREIRRSTGETGISLARRLGMTESAVSRIRLGKSYRHLLEAA